MARVLRTAPELGRAPDRSRSAARLWGALLAPALLAGRADAQLVEEIRDELQAALGEARYPAFVASLVDLAEENELSAANYRIDDTYGTTVGTIKLPYRKTFDADGDGGGAYLEGNLGYLGAEVDIPDLFDGATSVNADWSVYSGLIGGGATFALAEGLDLTPLFDLSLAYVESDASYGGPGAFLGPPLLDGLLFNWNAWLLTYGPGLRLDWVTPLSEEVELETIARYDLRRTSTLHSSDEALQDAVTSQRFTLRGDLTGPTPVEVAGKAMRWRGTLAYTWFPGDTGEALGFDSFVSVGGALELPLSDSIPLVSELTLSGALIYGPGVTGWTVGVGASF